MFFETYLYFVATKSVATSTRYIEVRLIGIRSKPINFRKIVAMWSVASFSFIAYKKRWLRGMSAATRHCRGRSCSPSKTESPRPPKILKDIKIIKREKERKRERQRERRSREKKGRKRKERKKR